MSKTAKLVCKYNIMEILILPDVLILQSDWFDISLVNQSLAGYWNFNY